MRRVVSAGLMGLLWAPVSSSGQAGATPVNHPIVTGLMALRSAALLVPLVLIWVWPAHSVSFDWITIGDPGNVPDTEVMVCCNDSMGNSGYGSVGYRYRISKYEVTNSQYADFLNQKAASDPVGQPVWEHRRPEYSAKMGPHPLARLKN